MWGSISPLWLKLDPMPDWDVQPQNDIHNCPKIPPLWGSEVSLDWEAQSQDSGPSGVPSGVTQGSNAVISKTRWFDPCPCHLRQSVETFLVWVHTLEHIRRKDDLIKLLVWIYPITEGSGLHWRQLTSEGTYNKVLIKRNIDFWLRQELKEWQSLSVRLNAFV